MTVASLWCRGFIVSGLHDHVLVSLPGLDYVRLTRREAQRLAEILNEAAKEPEPTEDSHAR